MIHLSKHMAFEELKTRSMVFDISQKIVFHHVPKCGGMSIAAGLALSYYPLRLVLRGKGGFHARLNSRAAAEAAALTGREDYSYRRELLAYAMAQADCPFIFGHYPFSEEVHVKHCSNWKFVTLLRDPVQRWFSEYNWNRYKDHAYGKTELEIEAYLHSAQGRKDARSYVNFFAAASDSTALASAQEAKHAIANLEKFDVVGKLGDLRDFSQQLKTMTGRKPFFYKRNASPASAAEKQSLEPGSESYKQLLELLAADIEIYHHFFPPS